MRYKLYFLALAALLSFSSCAKKFHYLDAYPYQEGSHFEEDKKLSINTYFAGDAISYLVYELDIENISDDTIYLSHRDISLNLGSNESHSLMALRQDDVIREIRAEQRYADQERKARNVESAVGIGVSLISIAAGGGGGGGINVVNNILYATESASYILEDNRAYKLIKGDLDEQIAYVEDWVLFETKIAPGETQSWDVLFERVMTEIGVDLVIKSGGKDYTFEYEQVIIEETIR